jgi:protein TonB
MSREDGFSAKSGRSGYLGILIVLGGFASMTWSCSSTAPQREKLPTFELPRAVMKVKPEYPDSARSANVSGTVLVRVLVGEDGHVKDAMVIRSIPMLDACALAAVRQWVFKPALDHNIPIAIWVAAPVRVTPD